MADETYNGWKNYPTWCVNMWLSNDEELYRETQERVANAVAGSFTYGDEPAAAAARFAVSKALSEFVQNDLAPDLGASFPADLLGWALAAVDWNEIADGWIEGVSELSASREP